MRQSSKAALGGIVSALAVILMLITYISPLFVYTAPPLAGILLIPIIKECGAKWAVGTYAAISLLSVFIIADKESAVFFTLFFGYYPIFKLYVDKKIASRAVRIILKLLLYNFSVALSVAVCMFVFNISYDDFEDGGKIFFILFAVLLNVLLFVLDILISKLVILYDIKLKKLFRRVFKH